ncbi:PIN domain-containing protein [Bernardetia sp. MNP-M8]|uniref:PIN domain-containing protein n=1 Tax=Bernardetia sp. MNP-M8 TaxID=3127470 RepID=UPI0030CB83E6
MEIYGYEFESQEEKQLIDSFFEGLEIVEVNREIAEQVIIYRKNKNKKIKLPDAIILATAKYLNTELITDDWDDFQNINNSITVSNIDNFKK